MRISSLSCESGGSILLLVLGAIHAEAVQWEEAGKPQLRTEMRAPGILLPLCPISAPIHAPLRACGYRGGSTLALLCLHPTCRDDGICQSSSSSFHPLSADHRWVPVFITASVLCWLPTALRGGRGGDAKMPGSVGWSWDRWYPCEILKRLENESVFETWLLIYLFPLTGWPLATPNLTFLVYRWDKLISTSEDYLRFVEVKYKSAW